MTEKEKNFNAIYPNKYFADGDDLIGLDAYLNAIGFLSKVETIVSTEVPGAGNMNYVLRVKTNERSFILKQSRPWVEKYPSIAAPIGRINIEAEFYKNLKENRNLQSHSPSIYHFDPDNFLMLIEDLGDVDDLTFIYRANAALDNESIKNLAIYLSTLHSLEVSKFPDNLEMRKLNHEHIFNYPYRSDNGFDLNDIQVGLSKLAVTENTDPSLVEIINQVGELYLRTEGGVLLHGDFYPGSWMKKDKLYVIDAEFAFLGPREFDLGVFIAHMQMASQVDGVVELFLKSYDIEHSIDNDLVYQFAGIEILRRLLGVAQLPLSISVGQKRKLIAQAKAWISK